MRSTPSTDNQELTIEETTKKEEFYVTYENAMEVIRELHEKFGGSTLFGNEKDDFFKSTIGQIYQTFGGIDLYPSVEEKAAMLLYLVTKNHSFSDGTLHFSYGSSMATAFSTTKTAPNALPIILSWPLH